MQRGYQMIGGVKVGELERTLMRLLNKLPLTSKQCTLVLYGHDYELYNRQAVSKSLLRLYKKELVGRKVDPEAPADRMTPLWVFSLSEKGKKILKEMSD